MHTQSSPHTADRARLAAELEQRTRELEQSRARFRDVIERNADAILVVDREGVVRFSNTVAAELFRSQRESLIGTPFGFPVLLGETTELDLAYRGTTRVVEMRVVESEWEGDTAYIASLRDITERKRAEEGARRLVGEQAARTTAEAAAHRFRFLAEASAQLSVPLEHAETVATLAKLCTTEIADWAAIYVVDEHGLVQRVEVAHCRPDKANIVRAIRELPNAPVASRVLLDVLRTRAPLLVPEADHIRLAGLAQSERHLELMKQLGAASYMILPMVARDRGLGAIALFASEQRPGFTEEDLAAANDLALRAALAIDNVRLYREAQAANKEKTDLLAVISHDLRTPLNSIMGHAELLSMGIPDQLSEAAQQRVGRIRISANHLVYLIDELLSFARLDAGHEEIRLQDLDARTVIREVAAVVEPLALDQNLAFHVNVPDDSVVVSTDPDRLRQILLNLVGNAVKYTNQGEVRLELTRAVDDAVCFIVRDTGIGIRPESLERIFEPFWQQDPAQRSNNGGTGLGLAVVRRLVRMLGGDIVVDSVFGNGSTFTVRLPSSAAVQQAT
jgi:signal transduction histidine kinase